MVVATKASTLAVGDPHEGRTPGIVIFAVAFGWSRRNVKCSNIGRDVNQILSVVRRPLWMV